MSDLRRMINLIEGVEGNELDDMAWSALSRATKYLEQELGRKTGMSLQTKRAQEQLVGILKTYIELEMQDNSVR
jgi:hypothetical protein